MCAKAAKKWVKSRLCHLVSINGTSLDFKTYYWFVEDVKVMFDVEPFRNACNGSFPPSSSQSIPTAWLLRFVESIEPLNQGWRLTLRS